LAVSHMHITTAFFFAGAPNAAQKNMIRNGSILLQK